MSNSPSNTADLLSNPVTDSLDFIFQSETVDPTTLIFDLNDLLRRDPTLSSLSSNIKQEVIDDNGVPIPKRNALLGDLMSTTANTTSSELGGDASSASGLSNVTVGATPAYGSSYGSGFGVSPMGGGPTSPSMWDTGLHPVKMEVSNETTGPCISPQGHPMFYEGSKFQPTLSQLNSPPADQDIIKGELKEFDWDAFFMKDESRNVTLQDSSSSPCNVVIHNKPHPSPSPSPLKSPEIVDPLLSSSVPTSMFNNPLGDLLPELNATNVPPATPVVSASCGGSNPSHAGPERVSTLHKLLMQQNRPSPVRSPESRNNPKTLTQMKNSLLSASNPLLCQQLSKSAPSQQSAYLDRLLWARREPRPHVNSVCSIGGESSVADEVSDVLNGLSPTDLPDIASDDETNEMSQEDDSSNDDDLSDDEDDDSERNIKTDVKKERHFWMYNVQAKGPKGQKIVVETKIEDPHELNDIVDPVFSGHVKLQGIKHSGKARRGDGNDLTANPKKLAAIGKELEALSKTINDLTPVSEMPFVARCKSRKEKNKLASRACRLKKKAQHEANKVKCCGLRDEHHQLVGFINRAKVILRMKLDPNHTVLQKELTTELDTMVKKITKSNVAGATTEFVNRSIQKYL